MDSIYKLFECKKNIFYDSMNMNYNDHLVIEIEIIDICHIKKFTFLFLFVSGSMAADSY